MPRVFMFDAYGTLFDVHSAVAQAGAPLGPIAGEFSALWRSKQLEYTWIYSAMGVADNPAHNFEALTARSLDFCLAKYGINNPALRADLLNAYQTLSAFADVIPALSDVKAGGNQTAIFTNGTRTMIDAALAASGVAGLIDIVITVEGTNFYKPKREVYQHAHGHVGAPSPLDVVFVSSNRWDVAGAANFGFTPVWCNRTGQPSEYGGFDPIVMVPDLTGIGGV